MSGTHKSIYYCNFCENIEIDSRHDTPDHVCSMCDIGGHQSETFEKCIEILKLIINEQGETIEQLKNPKITRNPRYFEFESEKGRDLTFT